MKNNLKGWICIIPGVALMVSGVCLLIFNKLKATFLNHPFIDEYRLFFNYVFVGFIFFGFLLVWLGRQYRAREKSIEKIWATSKQKPILYLRSFLNDKESSISTRGGLILPDATLEMRIRSATKRLGPLIAIGDPKEDMPTIGAVRSYYEHDDWQQRFKQYAKDAQLIILSIGLTESVMWELNELLRMKLEDKLVLHVKLPQQEWENFLVKFSSNYPGLDHAFPVELPGPVIMYFKDKVATCYLPKSVGKLAMSMYTNTEDDYILRSYLEEFKGMKKFPLNSVQLFILTIVAVLLITFLFMLVADPELIDTLKGE